MTTDIGKDRFGLCVEAACFFFHFFLGGWRVGKHKFCFLLLLTNLAAILHMTENMFGIVDQAGKE